MKTKNSAIIIFSVLLAGVLSSCGTTKPNNMTVTSVATSATSIATSESAITTVVDTSKSTTKDTTITNTPASEEITTTTTDVYETTVELSDEDIRWLTTQDIVYRSYKYTGDEDGTMAEPYILVEQNYKKKYVSFYMQFIGVNAFLSPDWDENLNVIDGSYWIQDFQNADGSEPDLTKVYVKYSPAQITLLYWDNGENRWLSEYPQEFIYQPD